MRKLFLVVGIVAVTALACSDPTSRLPTTPSAPGVVGLEIAGPASIAPGQSVQLVANVRLNDGTVKMSAPGTPLQWFSSNSAILRVTSAGLATGLQVGEARVFVSSGSGSNFRSANRDFVVLPDGTFRLVGVIFEAESPTIPVIGARVTVTPGSLTTVTGFDGAYKFYGVPADAVVTVMKTGYTTLTQPIQLASHATRNFLLAFNGTRLTLSGPYTLALDVTGSCSGNSPLNPSLQQRSYDATLTQIGPEITVALTEPRFRISSSGRGNKFTGRAGAGEVTFFLDAFDPYYYYYGLTPYPTIAERLSDNTILVSGGTVTATGSAAGLSGMMPGSMVRWDSRFPSYNTNALNFCFSSAIRFTLTPR